MTTGKLWRKRKERRDWARRLRSEDPGLEVVHPHAARNRCGEQRALGCRATRPGSRSGTPV